MVGLRVRGAVLLAQVLGAVARIDSVRREQATVPKTVVCTPGDAPAGATPEVSATTASGTATRRQVARRTRRDKRDSQGGSAPTVEASPAAGTCLSAHDQYGPRGCRLRGARTELRDLIGRNPDGVTDLQFRGRRSSPPRPMLQVFPLEQTAEAHRAAEKSAIGTVLIHVTA
ncbi:MAG: hypothetical protein JWP40_128 [Blastococcus sp.]|jgi:hypothetical protein|nr:hypothetical protein [Blastococcus sp.]